MTDPPLVDPSTPPIWLYVLQLLYVALLILVAVAYRQSSELRRLVPDPAGPIPLGVPWWGALGGITISLTGIFRNRQGWESSYHLWHISRPALGAIVGSVAYLIFVVVIRSTGAVVGAADSGGRPTFYLVAYIVGYREAIFRGLLRRAADALFSPGTKKDNEENGSG